VTRVKKVNEFSNKLIERYLNEKYQPNINNYDLKSKGYPADKKIWFCWLQGIDEAPKLVRDCLKSIESNIPDDYQINIIDDNNYHNYVVLNDYIIKKYNDGIISKAQFSDILRINLLSEYGGLWVDSTINIKNKNFIKNMVDGRCFSLASENFQLPSISLGRWTGFFFFTSKNNPAVNYMKDYFNNYWKYENKLINYFLIDYIFSITYEKFENFRRDIIDNSLPGDNKYFMSDLMTKKKLNNGEDYLLSKDKVGIFKLSHKINYK